MGKVQSILCRHPRFQTSPKTISHPYPLTPRSPVRPALSTSSHGDPTLPVVASASTQDFGLGTSSALSVRAYTRALRGRHVRIVSPSTTQSTSNDGGRDDCAADDSILSGSGSVHPEGYTSSNRLRKARHIDGWDWVRAGDCRGSDRLRSGVGCVHGLVGTTWTEVQ